MRYVPAIALLLASCAVPPPSSYISGIRVGRPEQAIDLGQNRVGESCVQSTGTGSAADIYCGSWQQPSARVRDAGPATSQDLANFATSGNWRTNLNTAYDCGQPQPLQLGSLQAVQMACTRRSGGWPHLALVALSDGKAWQADGVVSALPAVQRSIEILSGRITGTAVSSTAVAALQARREGDRARASATGDDREFDSLMQQGGRANLADDPISAESAYGAALAVQQKALGNDNPNVAEPEMHLALQLSNEGRFGEANAMFAHADTLVARQQVNPLLTPLLRHYEGLNALNQGKNEAALNLLQQAEAGYLAMLPADALQPRTQASSDPVINAALRASEPPERREVQAALSGLIEVRRYRAELLRGMGRFAESEAAIASATGLARTVGLDRPELLARLDRTNALTASSNGKRDLAISAFNTSSQAFTRAYPDSRPLALLGLLRARELIEAGQPQAAVPVCRAAIKVLVDIKSGYEPERMAACLDAFAAAAANEKDPKVQQPYLRDMFQASQLVRSSTTSQQIQMASARLAAGGGPSKVGDAIRDQQDSARRLADIRRRRETIADTVRQGAAPPDTKALDAEEQAAVTDLASRESTLQEAAPNYDQLIQQATSANDVLQALRPGEAFAAVTLTDRGGWTFLLHEGTVQVGRIDGDASKIAALVKRIRKGMEPDLPTFDTAAATDLYRDVFGSVTGGLDGVKALTVAPTGSLLSLPFAVLLTDAGDPANLANAPWLMRKMSIGHVPSAGNFVALRKIAGASKAPNPWFGFGDFHRVTLAQARRSFPASCGDAAQELAELPLLPSARQELDVARKLTGAGPDAELLGAAFTAPAVEQRQDLSSYRILHFAAHAILPTDLQCQNEPALVTSPPAGAVNAAGALLKASDLASIKLDADVVILSACNSGGPDGSATGGESLSDLARSFFYGGARSLLITHWEVSDQAATYMVADTLRRLRADPSMDVAGALQQAQLGVLQLSGRSLPAAFSHPFFWAPFALIGQANARSAGQSASL